jgi:PKD repeat protein
MADIGKVAGPLLEADLDRQGKALQFSTNAQPLLALDFEHFKAAINSAVTDKTFTVVGNVALDNIHINGDRISSVSGSIHLGDVSTVKVDGGYSDYIMTTDGAGNLSWKNIGDISHNLNLSASNIVLGTPTDGSLVVNSAYRYWNSNVALTDAIDNLNQVMLNVYQNTYVGAVNVTANVVAGSSPLTVQFNASILGNPTDFYWDFGDGNTSPSQNPTHTYSSVVGGVYSIYFKANNANGTLGGAGYNGDPTLAQGSYADKILTNYITVYTPLPVSTFTLDVTSINDNGSISLTNTSVHASSYVINWGDGTTTTIANNSVAGAPGLAPVSHTYHNVGGDHKYNVVLDAYSPTAQPGGITVSSSPESVLVYSIHAPTFTSDITSGNNNHNQLPTPQGLQVMFTNTTATGPGNTAQFPTNRYEYVWGDGTTTSVIIGAGLAGDLATPIAHRFTLNDPTIQQVFSVSLRVYNGNTFTPFQSDQLAITVKPDPTALFSATAEIVSDRIGDTATVGYNIVDLSGANRAKMLFTNTSLNANIYSWTYGDGNATSVLTEGAVGTPTGGAISHTYATTGLFDISLLANGATSPSPVYDTATKVGYISILTPPAPPSGLSTKTISMPTVGNQPLLAANATNHSTSSMPAAGNAVNRITTLNPVATTVASEAYNATAGTLSAIVNGATDGSVTLSTNLDIGTYSSLVVTEDKDANLVDASIYPSNFYKVFSGKISKTNATVGVGFNTFKLSHSLTGDTNELAIVKDDVTSVPSIATGSLTATVNTAGTLTYVSGVPYFTTGGSINISGAVVSSWIGQTYLNSLSPLVVNASPPIEGSGVITTQQSKTYQQLNGAVNYLGNGIPYANSGKVSYTLGTIPVTINGSVAAAGKLNIKLSNVNGDSSAVEVPNVVNVLNAAVTGINELSIPVSALLGSNFTDDGARVFISGASGPTPAFNSGTNYFTAWQFGGAIPISGTDEAVVRFGTLANNTTDYSTFLPPGPNLSGRTGTQYFRFAFRRGTVSNFDITYTGKVSGIHIAAPGTLIDQASSLNGWVDGSAVYAGAGVPGDITTYGNGSLGCAKTAGDVIPVGVSVTNKTCKLTLGSANSSEAFGDQILVSISLNAGDFVTSISIS